jgi:hypothetical protein
LPKKDILCVCVILFYLQNTVGYQYMWKCYQQGLTLIYPIVITDESD